MWQDRPSLIKVTRIKRIETYDWIPTIFHIQKWNQILYISSSNETDKESTSQIDLSFYDDDTYFKVHRLQVKNDNEYTSCALIQEVSQEHLLRDLQSNELLAGRNTD